jgi:predicted CoA-binding protein
MANAPSADACQASITVPSVAVIGASNNPQKFGHKAVRAYQRQGWTVYPVNPQEPNVAGLATFPDVEAIPTAVDRVALYVPAAVGIGLLPGIARKGTNELFVNPGAESDELLLEADRLKLNVIQACAIVDIGERP